jgi:hypothetical protein
MCLRTWTNCHPAHGPHGLVVVVQENGIIGRGDEAQIKRNRKELVRLLEKAGVKVELWPSAWKAHPNLSGERCQALYKSSGKLATFSEYCNAFTSWWKRLEIDFETFSLEDAAARAFTKSLKPIPIDLT